MCGRHGYLEGIAASTYHFSPEPAVFGDFQRGQAMEHADNMLKTKGN
jgi:hypothetical protein